MKRLFSSHLPWAKRADLLLVLLAVLGLVLTRVSEVTQRLEAKPDLARKMAAATSTVRCFEAIRQYRLGGDASFDRENDPEGSGLIGQEFTLITTDRGVLEAKLTSVNPNFAALFVGYLQELELKPGDTVAIAMTGSFPALNVAILAAAEELGLRPLPVTSVGASMWGANDPAFTWLDMESLLIERGLIQTRSIAASLGGSNDRGRGLSPMGRTLLHDAITRNGVAVISEPTLEESVARRVAVIDSAAGSGGIKAYINIGGGSASIGNQLNGTLIRAGVNHRLKRYNWTRRGVLHEYARRGVPIIHVLGVEQIAHANGFPVAPELVPAVGEGKIYHEEVYDLRIVVPAFLTFLVLCLGVLYTRHHAARQAALATLPPEAPAGESEPEDARTASPRARVALSMLIFFLALAPGVEAATRVKATSSAGKIGIRVDSKQASYDLATTESPVEIKVTGPVKIRVVSRLILPAPPRSTRTTYKLRIEAGDVVLRTMSAKAGVSQSALTADGRAVGTLQRKEIQIPGGTHTVRIVPVDGSQVAIRVFLGSGKQKIKWTPLAPESYVKAVRLQGRDSEATYYRFSQEHPVGLTIAGPAVLRVITRIDFGQARGYSQAYAIKVNIDSKPLKTFSLKATASHIATYPELPQVTPGVGRSLSFEVPKGRHAITIELDAATTKTASLRILIPRDAVTNQR